MTAPGIPNELVLSTSCFGSRLKSIEDQAFAAVAMGFRKIEVGLTEAPIEMHGFEDTQRETGLTVSSVVAGCLKPFSPTMASTLLGSPNPDEREQAMNSVRRHIRLAQQHGAPIVIVRGHNVRDDELNRGSRALQARIAQDGLTDEMRDEMVAYAKRVQEFAQPQLEHLCRSLHQVAYEYPDTKIAIEPGSEPDDLLGFDAMGWVLDDLSKLGIGYWHDVGRIHHRQSCGLPPQGRWLDAYASRMLGVHLQDAAEDETAMPPGTGEVDFRLVADYLPQDIPRVIEIAARHGRTEILGSVQFLVDLGLA